MDSGSSEYSSSLLGPSLEVSGATDEVRTFKLPSNKKNKQHIIAAAYWIVVKSFADFHKWLWTLGKKT